jgi:S1-C subfamily serine protease
MDIEQTLQSIVTVHSTIPEDAFTAGILGTERSGSGVVIRDSGLVLTIGYLITEAEEVWLTSADGRVTAGHALAYDQESGFGLVQALGSLNLPALELGNAGKAKVGDSVVLAGGGPQQAVRAQIVSKQEFAGYWEYLLEKAIFTVPAHPSWGGAGLIDANGKLIGIGSLLLQMSDQRATTHDVNMVVPIDLLPPILEDLTTYGRVNKPPRPWLGAYTAESDGKVVVMNVADDSPAARAGLQPGDVVADVRDQDVSGLADFYRKLWASGPAGTEIAIRVVRDSRGQWLRVKTADRNSFLKKPRLQ